MAGVEPEVWNALAPALSRSEFDLNQVPAIDSAIELVALIPFDMVLVSAREPAGIEQLVTAIRATGSASRGARIVLLAAPAQMASFERLLAGTGDLVLPAGDPAVRLEETILGFLRAKPRLAVRVMARLTVQLGSGVARILCQTRDLSRGGMLAITENRYPIGTPVEFAIDLPGSFDSVRGVAEVVRHAERGRDADDGLGLRFTRFAADGDRRLIGFLERHGA